MYVGASGLLGTKEYKIDWLSSGTYGTSEMNCIKMARVITYIMRMWNYVNFNRKSEGIEALVAHYEEVSKGKVFPKGKGHVWLHLNGYYDPMYKSEGLTMENSSVI